MTKLADEMLHHSRSSRIIIDSREYFWILPISLRIFSSVSRSPLFPFRFNHNAAPFTGHGICRCINRTSKLTTVTPARGLRRAIAQATVVYSFWELDTLFPLSLPSLDSALGQTSTRFTTLVKLKKKISTALSKFMNALKIRKEVGATDTFLCVCVKNWLWLTE